MTDLSNSGDRLKYIHDDQYQCADQASRIQSDFQVLSLGSDSPIQQLLPLTRQIILRLSEPWNSLFAKPLPERPYLLSAAESISGLR
jgi:hypothetical protein